MKYVVKLQKMFRVLQMMDLWKSGMREDSVRAVVPHPACVVDAGGDSRFATS